MEKVNRRSFIHASAGAATGAVIAATPAALVLDGAGGRTGGEPAAGVVVEPSAPPPREAVVAYVRDAERGEVTVVSGTVETTYHDPVLVARLLAAVPPQIGGELGVVTP
jgi:hypothetical protein